jgi:hypothetical protein
LTDTGRLWRDKWIAHCAGDHFRSGIVEEGSIMKKALCALAVAALFIQPAFAGGMAEPVMEPEIIAQESAGTGGGWVVPLILIAIVAAVASSSGGSTPLPDDV